MTVHLVRAVYRAVRIRPVRVLAAPASRLANRVSQVQAQAANRVQVIRAARVAAVHRFRVDQAAVLVQAALAQVEAPRARAVQVNRQSVTIRPTRCPVV